MGFQLSPEAQNNGYRLEGHDTVGSTNAMALERANSGDQGRLWIAALKQEAGRGRRNRVWESPHGNLAATLLHIHDGDMAQVATLGFVAGLALKEALDAVAPRYGKFALKWPNDVLADGKKLSGILLESVALSNGALGIAVGIGVNIIAHPPETPFPATSLAAENINASAELVFLALSDAWVTLFRLWNNGAGLDAIRKRWLVSAAGLGSEIAINHNATVLRGRFETIDADCRIVIRDDRGLVHHINAGDVYFGNTASVKATP
jgi:BirA family transcriptional regulator, biotin operon repressor / biotin---[acetyl-CoA-carboxylase] ligase